jgi:hypothetical protein
VKDIHLINHVDVESYLVIDRVMNNVFLKYFLMKNILKYIFLFLILIDENHIKIFKNINFFK